MGKLPDGGGRRQKRVLALADHDKHLGPGPTMAATIHIPSWMTPQSRVAAACNGPSAYCQREAEVVGNAVVVVAGIEARP